MKKQIVRIIIFLLIIVGLGFYMHSKGIVLGTKANVVGSLLFTYPNGTTPETLFNELDFKPGDCKEAEVDVKNLSAAEAIVGVFSDGETESDGLSGNLEITITDGVNILYGPLPLSDFFADSDILNEIELITLGGNATVTLHFKVCFPDTDDNELQGDSVVFDLKFGHIKPPIDLPDPCNELEGIVKEIIEGTEGDDNIHGTTANELIIAKGGNDRIHPSSGSDCIIAGDGNDRVIGTTGNEIIVGGKGDDILDGGTGNDTVFGGDGKDKITGGSGVDNLYGGADDDEISGGSGNDYIEGGGGNDEIDAGSGDDEVHGEAGADTISGGMGVDKLYGEGEADNIRGNSGNDYLNGGPGTDDLDGDSNNDSCEAGETYTSCEVII